MHTVTLTAPRAVIESVSDMLTRLDPSPAEAVDAREETRTHWKLDAYCADEAAARTCADLIEAEFPGLEAGVKALEDRDWVALSLEGLPAVKAGPFIVAGAHELARAHAGRIPVWIEAGPAFGTGHHGTTAGCLEAYSRLMRRGTPNTVLDIGTGSGVLAIAALKSGAKRALGTEIDAPSLVVAKENAYNNRVGRRLSLSLANGVRGGQVRAGAPYDLVFANILAGPLIRLSADIPGVMALGGHLILSGLLTPQEPLVRAAYRGRGLIEVDRIRMNGWSTLVYQTPDRG